MFEWMKILSTNVWVNDNSVKKCLNEWKLCEQLFEWMIISWRNVWMNDNFVDNFFVQAKIQKHQAFEAEVAAHSNAIVVLDNTGMYPHSTHPTLSSSVKPSIKNSVDKSSCPFCCMEVDKTKMNPVLHRTSIITR